LKVCFVYSNRSELSILSPFIKYFQKKVDTNVIDVSKLVNKIEDDSNLHKIYQKCYEEFKKKKFDYVIILGDRRELPFIAFAALFVRLKIVHIAAGEHIEGLPTYDQLIRPILSILSNYQICFSKKAKKDVKKLLSSITYLNPDVHFIGNPVFRDIDLERIERKINGNYDLVLLHPQSLSRENTKKDVEEIKKHLKKKKTVFISGNKDRNYDIIQNFYKKLKSNKKKYLFFDSLPKEEYFSLVKYCDNFFTNSSSISEVKLLNKKSLKMIGLRNRERVEIEFNNNAPEFLLKILKNRKN